jgi:hypothetical protein
MSEWQNCQQASKRKNPIPNKNALQGYLAGREDLVEALKTLGTRVDGKMELTDHRKARVCRRNTQV